MKRLLSSKQKNGLGLKPGITPCVCYDQCRNSIVISIGQARSSHNEHPVSTQNTMLAPTTQQTRGRLTVCNLGSVMILLASVGSHGNMFHTELLTI